VSYCQERDCGTGWDRISHKINNILIPKNLSWVQKTATAVADTTIEALSMGGTNRLWPKYDDLRRACRRRETENDSTRHPVFAASALGQDCPAGN
jgi:hypothetical protein